jgi:hypothetical protein
VAAKAGEAVRAGRCGLEVLEPSDKQIQQIRFAWNLIG